MTATVSNEILRRRLAHEAKHPDDRVRLTSAECAVPTERKSIDYVAAAWVIFGMAIVIGAMVGAVL